MGSLVEGDGIGLMGRAWESSVNVTASPYGVLGMVVVIF